MKEMSFFTMLWRRLYRGVESLLAPFRRVDDEPAAKFLSAEAFSLFQRMSLVDRAHSLRVYFWLQQHGHDEVDLLTAGLLHDCGKAAAHLNVAQRTLKVLLKWFFPPLWRRLSTPVAPEHWRYPLYILARHPQLGAEWARQAGCSALTCWLIAHHEENVPSDHPHYPLLRALKDADAAS